ICARHRHWCWPDSPPRARRWLTGSIISTAATSGSRRSSRPAARVSKDFEVPPDAAPLKLRAEDAEDLAVISACLQDALVTVRDLAYVPQERSFLLVANRFRWEIGLRPALGEAAYERVLCGITFSEVAAVSYSGFRRSDN